MADQIRVSTEQLERLAQQLSEVERVVSEVSGILADVNTSKDCGGEVRVQASGPLFSGSTAAEVTGSLRSAMRRSGESIAEITGGIRRTAEAFERAEAEVRSMGAEVQGVAALDVYNSAGDGGRNGPLPRLEWLFVPHLIPWYLLWTNQIKPLVETVITDPFDALGQYGGDQGSPVHDYRNHGRFREIIERNTGHTFANDQEFKTYLDRMNSEGCGYVAICNSIFAAYRGDPDGFRDAFGFDMYKGTDLNYNELFVDLYSRWDNRTASGEFLATKDQGENDPRGSAYDYWTDSTGSGTNIEWRGDISVQYLRQHGINATSEVHSGTTLTADMYNTMVANGEVEQGQLQIRLEGEPARLYDSNGNVACSYSGGHAMTVTGTTGSGPDAMLVVSSWGKTYYVKPADALGAGGNSGVNMGYMVLRIQK